MSKLLTAELIIKNYISYLEYFLILELYIVNTILFLFLLTNLNYLINGKGVINQKKYIYDLLIFLYILVW